MLPSYSIERHTHPEEGKDMSARNKAAMRRIYDEIWNQGKMDAVDELFSPDYVDHLDKTPGAPTGREGLRWFVQHWRGAFPDIHVQVLDQIAEGDKVLSRISFQGTQTGPFMGHPPSGREVSATAMVLTRFEDGRNCEGWVEIDRITMLRQLGVLPAPEAS